LTEKEKVVLPPTFITINIVNLLQVLCNEYVSLKIIADNSSIHINSSNKVFNNSRRQGEDGWVVGG
jgi:hypothetical protein